MQNKTRYFIASLGAIAILGAGFAVAHKTGFIGHHGKYGHHGEYGEMRGQGGHEQGERGQIFTARFDSNGDGKVSQDEINALQDDYFKNADADNNGTLSLEEFETYFTQQNRDKMVRSFQRLDSDGNASVTQAEFSAHMQNRVAMMDRNGDNVITSEDFGRGGKGGGKGWGWGHGKGEGHGEGKGYGKGGQGMNNDNN